MPLTVKELMTYTRDTLAEGVVEVELTDNNIKAAIKSATSLLSTYAPQRRWGRMPEGYKLFYTPTASGGGRFRYSPTELVPPTDGNVPDGWQDAADSTIVIPGLQRIVEVIGVRDRVLGNAQIDLFDPLIYIAGGIQNATGLATYNMAISYLKEVKKIVSSTVDWRWQWTYDETLRTRVGELYIFVPDSTRLVYGIEMLIGYTPDDDEKTGLLYVQESYEQWMRDYVVAASKYILGLVRGKFGGIPAADGSQMPMNAVELTSSGSEEMRALRQDLIARRPTPGFTRG